MTGTPRTIDELASLLPRWHQQAGQDEGEALRALLAVIAEQIDHVRGTADQQYQDWFVETAAARVLPLIGELAGYRTLAGYQRIRSEGLCDGGPSETSARRLAEALAPRRDVAATVGYRRRKGTLSLLEELAESAAGWPARAVETSRLLAHSQPVRLYGSGTGRADTVRAARGRLADLRDGGALDLAGTAFETIARTVDVRRGHLPTGVKLYVWRLKPYSVTRAPAHCVDSGRNLYTFSLLGNDTQLVTRPEPEPSTTHLATVDNVPARLRRRHFADRLADYYGPGKSVAVWLEDRLVPASSVVVADLTGWRYHPRRGQVVIDPELGRIAFHSRSAPDAGVWVTYHHAFSDDLGGGEYPRDLATPDGVTVYQVGAGRPYRRIADAHRQWRADRPARAVIEITGNGAYPEPLDVDLAAGQHLTLRAADGARPVLRLLDWAGNQPDALRVSADGDCAPHERPSMTIDGLLVTGRGIHATGPLGALTLRHTTLVPGWSLEPECTPSSPREASLVLERTTAAVHIDRCVLGSIQVLGDEVRTDPLPIRLHDSILDATGRDLAALSGADGGHAHADLHAHRTTVLGEVHVHAVSTASDSIFTGLLHVARRQTGGVRFSYLPPGSRTPRRYRCPSGPAPVLVSERYGTAGYAQLAGACPDEITRGAEDGSEMGAFHDLYQPQRADNLRARLAEYTPAGVDAAIVYVS
ncbi:hypothetical protein [Actinoplanes sp. GCM10030250]|uniref:hypothetical protein n=1 Tax=Actinoplanes sp. GCM10030250 TaxID=3273376 RepID=UPI00362309CF